MIVARFRGVKLHCMFLFFVFVLLYILGSLYWIFTQNSLSDASFLETSKCPVCFGDSVCKSLFANKIQPVGISKIRSIQLLKSRNVYYATHSETNRKYVIKNPSTSHEFRDLDMQICEEASMDDDCDVSHAVYTSNLAKESAVLTKFVKNLQGTSPMFICPSTRLINTLLANYVERTDHNGFSVSDNIKIWTAARISAESLLLQTFPAAKGWPFPRYEGACGRYIVLEDAGTPLSHFYTAPWIHRVDLAYQVIKLAETLTNNKEEFSIYLTDVHYDDFFVDDDGAVRLVDLKDVVVVDKQAIKAAKPDGWEDLLESSFAECPGNTFRSCHTFSETQLCSHVTSDHNYYVICRYILSHYPSERDLGEGRPDGLLHDMPDTARNDWDLEYLLNECVSPTRQRGRLQVVHKLIEALGALRQTNI